ncbi:helix-turn-helix domain-containing protein [bacterium]|nr:helix-turn-helix domain-containing protein [bacterium]
MSQSDLSFELGLANSLVSKVESGKYGKKYNVHHLNEIARVLDCSPADFLPDAPL